MANAKQSTPRDVYLKVSRPRNECLLCSQPLNLDTKHPSLIELEGKEEVIRKDFCGDCWERIREQGYFSFWITKRVNEPSAKERRLAKSERNEALWRLFAALHGSEEEDFRPQLFLLAHLLMKYKVLQFAGTEPGGRLKFLHPKLGEEYLIEDLPLDSTDFVSVLQEVEKQAIDYAPESQEEPQEPPESHGEA